MSLHSDDLSPAPVEIYSQALMLIQQAIDLLDCAKAPADIAAHLDRAAQRLSDVTGLIS